MKFPVSSLKGRARGFSFAASLSDGVWMFERITSSSDVTCPPLCYLRRMTNSRFADWRQCCSENSRDLLASTHYPTLQAASSSLVWQPRPDNLTCGVSSVFCAMVSRYGLRLRIAMHSTVCMFFSSKSVQCQDFGLCSFSGNGCTHHSTNTMPKQEQLTQPRPTFYAFCPLSLALPGQKNSNKSGEAQYINVLYIATGWNLECRFGNANLRVTCDVF